MELQTSPRQRRVAREPAFNPTCLDQWRDAAGLTKAELAAEIDFSEQHLGAVCNGHKQYTQEIIEKACKALRRVFPALAESDVIGTDPNSDAGRAIIATRKRGR